MKLLSIVHLVHQIAAEAFEVGAGTLDVTPRQGAVLKVIGANPGASQTDVVVATGIDRSTLADIVNRIKKKGWITRKRRRSDARAYELDLTGEGKRVLRLASLAAEKAEAALRDRVDGIDDLRIKPKPAPAEEKPRRRAA
jgi:MarR family transcriptional regulator, temperature-dependent positive regulator of motility